MRRSSSRERARAVPRRRSLFSRAATRGFVRARELSAWRSRAPTLVVPEDASETRDRLPFPARGFRSRPPCFFRTSSCRCCGCCTPPAISRARSSARAVRRFARRKRSALRAAARCAPSPCGSLSISSTKISPLVEGSMSRASYLTAAGVAHARRFGRRCQWRVVAMVVMVALAANEVRCAENISARATSPRQTPHTLNAPPDVPHHRDRYHRTRSISTRVVPRTRARAREREAIDP